MRRFSPLDVFLFGVLSASMACNGTVVDNLNGSTGPAGGMGNGREQPGGGTGSGPGSTGGSTTPAALNGAGPMPLQRLTNEEYDNTVRDLLGDSSRPADQFATDRQASFEFRRGGDVALQDATLFRGAAETLAGAAVPRLAGMLPCNPAMGGEEACAQKFIETFGRRAFRRPLTSDESKRLMVLYSAGRNALKLGFGDAIGLLIEAMLQTPQFLYHWEAAPEDDPIHDGGVIRLGSYQVASRLSYFLWGSMPDDELLTAAGAGELDTPAGVEQAARRLLADPKAKAAISRFFVDWLELDALADRAKDTKAYPVYTPALQQAMLDEARTYFRTIAFDGGGLLSTFLAAPYSFVNSALAPLYGAKAMGATLQRTELNPAQRAGFLTQAGFLALNGALDGSHPVLRGKAVYTKLLCNELPPPPANVPPPKPASEGGTTRQRFVEHDENACAKACHGAIDPIGYAFENYDGIGQYRTTDNGLPVDATGALMLDGKMHSFDNAVGMVNLLAESAEVRACFAKVWSRFALSRVETEADAASIQSVATTFNNNTATIQDLLAGISSMRSFRFRSLSLGETP